jgi:hypothetical protein
MGNSPSSGRSSPPRQRPGPQYAPTAPTPYFPQARGWSGGRGKGALSRLPSGRRPTASLRSHERWLGCAQPCGLSEAVLWRSQHLYTQQQQALPLPGPYAPNNGQLYGNYPPAGRPYPHYPQVRRLGARCGTRSGAPAPSLGLLAFPWAPSLTPGLSPPQAPPRAAEQTQRTNTIRNSVNLKKPSLKLVPVPEVRQTRQHPTHGCPLTSLPHPHPRSPASSPASSRSTPLRPAGSPSSF